MRTAGCTGMGLFSRASATPSSTEDVPALRELIKTEVQYCCDLEWLCDTFLAPLRELQLLSKQEQRAIFSNCETLRGINRALRDDLVTEEGSTLAGAAAAFERFAPYFKAYSVYCADFVDAQSHLQELRAHCDVNSPFEAALQDAERTSGQGVHNLLIKPVQRLCKCAVLPPRRPYCFRAAGASASPRSRRHSASSAQQAPCPVPACSYLGHSRPSAPSSARACCSAGVSMRGTCAYVVHAIYNAHACSAGIRCSFARCSRLLLRGTRRTRRCSGQHRLSRLSPSQSTRKCATCKAPRRIHTYMRAYMHTGARYARHHAAYTRTYVHTYMHTCMQVRDMQGMAALRRLAATLGAPHLVAPTRGLFLSMPCQVSKQIEYALN